MNFTSILNIKGRPYIEVEFSTESEARRWANGVISKNPTHTLEIRNVTTGEIIIVP